ncbi:MAG TPA: DUF2339 domain-containing protein [Caulobacteraceae bacterium]|nr:DUF2339 domain-containing protein [Caulobacteraceae bacterium]
MVWLALIGLTVWLIVQQSNLGDLRREIAQLRRLLGEPAKPPQAAATGITPAMQAAARVAAEAAARQETITPPTAVAPVVQATEPATALEITQFTPAAPPPPAPRPPPTPAAPPLTRATAERWLAEKGLAWIGGSALVIGGAFLVGYAAQRGFFTPLMRVGAATVLGFVLLGAGELIRRRRLAGFGENRLAAAIVTGAGAAMLYGTTLAAFDLYGFITGAVCAGLLAIIAWGLLGLAFIHGEALAVLAIGGAFVVPIVSGAGTWNTEALTLYLGILIIAGVAVGWLRGWSVAVWTTLGGAAVWSLLGTIEQQSLKALLLGLEPLAAIVALTYVRPRSLNAAVGAGAVILASCAAFVALTMAYAQNGGLLEGVIAAIALPGLGAALQRRGQATAWILAIPGAAFTLAAAAARLEGFHSLTLTEIWCLQVLALDVASLWAVWREPQRAASGVGALSSLALALAAGAGIGVGSLAPLGPAIACVALALGALRLATDRSRPADQRALEIWGGGSAAALLATVALGLSWRWAGIGFALASLGLALAARRLKWRSIAAAAAAGAAMALASLLSPVMLAHALGDGGDAGVFLVVALLVAGASFVAARIVAHETAAAEALRTVSPLAALIGAFVFLRWAAGGGATHMDGLTESSIRTFLIAAAGLASLARLPAERSAFARWRGHLLMGAAAAHGFFLQVLLYNPRLGFFGDTASGPPLLDGVTLAFAAPALVFGAAAARIYRQQRPAARTYAVIALLSGVTWAFLEIRRLAHGPHLGGDALTIGAAESVGCSLVLLLLAVAIDRLRSPSESAHPVRADLGRVTPLARWIAIAFTLYMAGAWSNPCWGVADRAIGGWPALMAILAGYGAVAILIAVLALEAHRAGRTTETELIADSAIVMGLIFAGLVVRAAFHGTQLTLAAGAGELETWSYSGVGAVMGLAFVGFSRRGGRLFLRAGLTLLLLTTLKVFIVDTASLSGVVRAGSFLALGVLLLLGALTARRVARAAAPQPVPTDPSTRQPG